MRALAKTATGALVALGIVGTHAATRQGNEIAGDELATAVVTGQLSRSMDAAYADGQEAVRATDRPAEDADVELFGRQWAAVRNRLERLADAALYLAKRQGRNRVVLAEPSPPGPRGTAPPR